LFHCLKEQQSHSFEVLHNQKNQGVRLI